MQCGAYASSLMIIAESARESANSEQRYLGTLDCVISKRFPEDEPLPVKQKKCVSCHHDPLESQNGRSGFLQASARCSRFRIFSQN